MKLQSEIIEEEYISSHEDSPLQMVPYPKLLRPVAQLMQAL